MTHRVIKGPENIETHENCLKVKCISCGQDFGLGSDLRNHMNSSHEELPLIDYDKCKCGICGLTLYISSIRNHIKTVHKGVENHKCENCDLHIYRDSDLQKHIITVHKG